MGEQYMIWSHEHRMWWRPNHQGYTKNVKEAGLYDDVAALRIHVNAVPHGIEVAVPEVTARRHGTNVVFNADPWPSNG